MRYNPHVVSVLSFIAAVSAGVAPLQGRLNARARSLASLPACPTAPPPLTSWRCPAASLGEELLVDPLFTGVPSKNWNTFLSATNGATFQFRSPGAIVTTTDSGDINNAWHVQLMQAVRLSMAGGNPYELCIQVAAEADGILQFAIDADQAFMFAVAGGGVRTQMVLAPGATRTQCFRFTLENSTSTYVGRVAIDFGATRGRVALCQASLRRCSAQFKSEVLLPVRRCYLDPPVAGAGCTLQASLTGKEFGLNEYGQETSGRLECLARLRYSTADTFVHSVGQCDLWQCSTRARLVASSTGDPKSGTSYSQLCEYQENVGGRLGLSPRSPVIVKLWEWNYPDIARECQEYLGPNGIDAVQISPVMEHVTGSSWWTKYQPVSFKLDSRSGNQQAFAKMVQTCRAAGVQVLVDVILNHIATPCKAALDRGTAAVMPCKGWAGSPYGNRRINSDEGWKGPELFHHLVNQQLVNCAVNEQTWTCPDSVPPGDCTFCDFKTLPDWNTGLSAVQDTLFKHLELLYQIGVTMIRLDAASYVQPRELAVIVNRAPWDYVYQEWWETPPEVDRTRYVGHYRDVRYGLNIMTALAISDITVLPQLLNLSGGVPGITPDRAIYPLTFHDQRTTDADRFIPTYKNGLEYHLQQKFLLAWPQGGIMRLWGGYGWMYLDDGPPGCQAGDALCSPMSVWDPQGKSRCLNTPTVTPLSAAEISWRTWICEHRWTGIAGLVNFRKACGHLPVTQTWSNQTHRQVLPGRLAFRAGGACFSALSLGYNAKWPPSYGHLGDWSLAGLATGLPPGRYCDLSSLPTQRCWDQRTCPKEVLLGPGGTVLSGWVREGELLAIHVGARISNTSKVVQCQGSETGAASIQQPALWPLFGILTLITGTFLAS